ncbi:hypothetical protein OTU49_008356 [Cherax quadricarinatus]|uniref:Uncharacterized protein n=1 Tax=Cherax quadricarinatus TaxID=27406 RepID=A0AAW0WRB9_CHEQU
MLRNMENDGYMKEDSCCNSQKQDIHPTAPVGSSTTVIIQGDSVLPQTSCQCIEKQDTCTCSSSAPKTKVELVTWVKPKGWMLLVIIVAFVAWSAIYFTLSGLDKI